MRERGLGPRETHILDRVIITEEAAPSGVASARQRPLSWSERHEHGDQKASRTQEAAPDTSGPRRMLNQEQVLQIVPVCPVTLWRMEKAGRFRNRRTSARTGRVWFADEIIRWQDEVNGRGRGRANHLSEAT